MQHPQRRPLALRAPRPVERGKLERLARVLDVPMGQAKQVAFKKRALLEVEEPELKVRALSGGRGQGMEAKPRSSKVLRPQPRQRPGAGPPHRLAAAAWPHPPSSLLPHPRTRSHPPPTRHPQSRITELSTIVGVTPEQARRMAAIQPNLLLEPKVRAHQRQRRACWGCSSPTAPSSAPCCRLTPPPDPCPTPAHPRRPANTNHPPSPQRNGEALSLGLRAICYELDCPKEEAVDLILNNRSILHGREMHLSVADIAHLAMLRQPTGRIVD
jgi:hypothetical protein